MEKAKEEQTLPQSPAMGAQPQPTNGAEKLVKSLPKNNMKKNLPIIVACLFVVLSGVATGWFLASGVKGDTKSGTPTDVAPGAEVSSKEAGISDESEFSDTAEGVLEEGGIKGEGTHHLTREGGASKNVYLTSTVVDLDKFVGKKVQVWGATVSAKEAGWLMDVGKIKEL